MRIPFIGPSATGYSTNINAQRTINFFKAVDDKDPKVEAALYGTPGLVLYSQVSDQSTYSAIRALYVMEGLLYIISGKKAYVYDKSTQQITAITGELGTAKGNIYLAANLREDGSQIMVVDGSEKGRYIQKKIDRKASGTLTVNARLTGRSKGVMTINSTPLENQTFKVGAQTFKFVTQATNDAVAKAISVVQEYAATNNIPVVASSPAGGK